MSFNACWHCRTNGDVLAAWRAFRAAWLSEQILTYFFGLTFIWISLTHSKIAHTSAWETVACFPRDTEPPSQWLLIDSSPGPLHHPGPISESAEPFNYRRSPRSSGPVFSSQRSSLYWGSRLKAGLVTSTPILNTGSDLWSHISILLCLRLGWR